MWVHLTWGNGGPGSYPLLYNSSVCFLFAFTETHRKTAAADLVRVIQEAYARFRKWAADFEEPPRTLGVSLGRAFCCSRGSVNNNKCFVISSFSLLCGSSFWGLVNMALSLLAFFECLRRQLGFCYQTCCLGRCCHRSYSINQVTVSPFSSFSNLFLALQMEWFCVCQKTCPKF